MTDVIKAQRQNDKWKVLVLDRLSTRILSACCKMTDIMQERITLIEDLTKKRQPITNMEAIYFITPSEDSIARVLSDFADPARPQYKGVHLYFTDSLPDMLFNDIKGHRITKYIKTFTEVNIAFLPYESQVYLLDAAKTFRDIYQESSQNRQDRLERYADQLATLCSILGEYPSIRPENESQNAIDLAHFLQAKLNGFKADNPKLGEGPFKDQTQLIIIDRGYDPVAPIIHELTYQAMVNDLLEMDGDVIRYTTTNDQGQEQLKEVILDEHDTMWTDYQHQHIADCMRQIPEAFKNFAKEKRHKTSSEKATIKDLSKMMQAMPQYQKEIQMYLNHMHIIEDCQKHYAKNVEKLCKVEQDMAGGTDAEGQRLRNPMQNVIPILLDATVNSLDKIRIILLYIYHKGGITEENLKKLISHAEIPERDECIIRNMTKLNIQIFSDANKNVRKGQVAKKDRSADVKYQLSRFTPAVKDIMEYAIDGKLDDKVFQFLSGTRPMVSSGGVRSTFGGIFEKVGDFFDGSDDEDDESARYHWHKKDGDKSESKAGPRLILFVLGGVTSSEMRCAYEVTKNYVPQKAGNRGNKNATEKWEVLIGSTHICKPHEHLLQVRSISEPNTNNNSSHVNRAFEAD